MSGQTQGTTGSALKKRLLTPAALTQTAPSTFRVVFDTTAMPFVIEVHRDWAPRGADRFYNLVINGFYDGCAFFRVVPRFMVQFGIQDDPAIQAAWQRMTIPDDPVTRSNTRGVVSFVAEGPNTRTTQVFINYGDNKTLDAQGFAPFGQIVDGRDAPDAINAEYLERPDPHRLEREGRAYLLKEFPRLSYIKHAYVDRGKPSK